MGRRDLAPLLAEGVGTLLFFFVGAGAVVAGADLVGVALAHGLALATLVSALGAISGAHFNPAVSVAILLAGRMPAARAAAYVVAQLIGALGAGVLLGVVFAGGAAESASGLGTPTLGADVSPLGGILIEAVLTVLLAFAVFGTAVDPRAPRIGGLAIGLAVAADILMGGPLTGAAMNPARWFGPAVVSGQLQNWYVWIVGPLLGAAVAALLWRGLFLEQMEPARGPASPTADRDEGETTSGR